MRIESVHIKNLRCIKDTVIHLDPYTCLVGPNGAGKSTVLFALNIFFREVENAPTDVTSLTVEDFHLQDTTSPIEVTVTFSGLSKEAEEDFKDYVRQGKLTISAMAAFSNSSNRAEVRQFGQRLGIPAFKPFFKAYGDGASGPRLKELFEALEQDDPELATFKGKKTKEAMYETLREFESERPDQCVLLPSEDHFYGISKGANRLQKYVQWVFVPAVKDAAEEQSESKNGALGKLLARTVRAKVNFVPTVEAIIADTRRKYQEMLNTHDSALADISESLKSRLAEWAHPEATLKVAWQLDSTKAVKVDPPLAGIIAGECGFEGNIVRFGHGFQRSYLLALLQELATGYETAEPTLILGCEEPELYQHPPQARHLSGVLEKLSEENAQIIVTTHSPYFVTGKNFESVRIVRRSAAGKRTGVRQYSFSKLAAKYSEVVGEQMRSESAALSKVHQALQPSLNEIFFAQKLVLVEGLEDVAYIHSWLVLTDRWEAFRRSGCHIVPTNGKSEMIRPAIIALGLGVPTLAIVDADGDKIANPTIRTRHHRDNAALLRLFGGDSENVFPTGVEWLDSLVMWPADLEEQVKRESVVAIGVQGHDRFESLRNQANAQCGNAGDLKKNAMYIAALLALLFEAGIRPQCLERLCEKVLTFGGSSPAGDEPISG